jgi:glycosyltransferase involved in cell wall biosynthesis
LLIVGDGPEKPGLEALARELGIADITEFTGHMAQPSAAFRRMDLFALSSDTEQLPIAMLEAMAHALPVVATAVGDVPHVLPPQAASMLAEPDDAAFQATLARALQHRDAWRELAAAGQAVVSGSYARESMHNDWLKIFNGGWPKSNLA